MRNGDHLPSANRQRFWRDSMKGGKRLAYHRSNITASCERFRTFGYPSALTAGFDLSARIETEQYDD